MATALAFAPPVSPLASEVSTTLTVGAGVAYEVFADAVEVTRWLYLNAAVTAADRSELVLPLNLATAAT